MKRIREAYVSKREWSRLLRSRSVLLLPTFLLVLVTLNLTFAQRPELIVQTGHANSVAAVAFSADDRYVVSGGGDGPVVVWDVRTGRQVRSLLNKGSLANQNAISLSANGRLLSSTKGVRLWDVNTGQAIKIPEAEGAATLTSDGKTLAFVSGFTLDKISLLDIDSGQVVSVLSAPGQIPDHLAFSPDGAVLAAATGKHAGSDPGVRLWEVKTGKVRAVLGGHDLGANVIAFTADGQTLATADIYSLKLWDVSNGKLLRTLKTGGESLAFSPDGRTLAVGSEGNETTLWDLTTSRVIRSLPGGSSKVAFSADGRLLANSWGATVYLWEVATGRQVGELRKRSQDAAAVAVSPNGKYLATGSTTGQVLLWDLSAGKEPLALPDHGQQRVHSLAFSPDSQRLAAGGGHEAEGELTVWDIETGQRLYGFKGDAFSEVSAVAFSADAQMLVTWHGSGLVPDSKRGLKYWDAATGRALRSLGGDHNQADTFSGRPGIVFSPAGNAFARAVAREKGQTIELWQFDGSAKIRDFDDFGLEGGGGAPGSSSYSYHVAFSSDGKTLARVVAAKGEELGVRVRLWNIDTGTTQELKTERGYSPEAIVFSPNGSTLAINLSVAQNQRAIKLLDIETKTELRTIAQDHGVWVRSSFFSHDGQVLIASAENNSIELLDVAKGDELARLVAVDERDWLVVAPGGLFDGSAGAWAQVLWRFTQNTADVAPVEAFFSDFYHPDLLAEIMAGEHPQSEVSIAHKDIRQPVVRLTEANAGTPNSAIAQREITVQVEVTAAPANERQRTDSGAQDVRLFRNGSLVKVWSGDVLQGKSSATLVATIPIVAGENRLTAYAFNRDNIKSSDAVLTLSGAENLQRAGVLYVLAIGVGQYANPRYNLNYTVSDAQDFADEIKRQQEKVGRYQRVEVTRLFDQEATKANILAALKTFAGAVQPEDGAIVYFSGHGTAQKDRFYLIPHDLGFTGARAQLRAAGLEIILAHSVSDLELEEAFRGIDAGQLLLVIDACNSGQALEAKEKRRGPMNTKGLAQLAYEKGMYVLTASQNVELAYESEALKHSYLTYALIEEGLKTGAADQAPKDGQVLLREWFDYATQAVPRLRQAQVEQLAKKHGKALEEVEVAEKAKVQQPRVFYRREADVQPLIVAKP
jgi:WD40 repeat protein